MNIVIIAKNANKNLEQIILALKNKTNHKLILVNNGCDQKTAKILDFYNKKEKDIKSVKLQAYNTKKAKEEAIKLCREEYTLFIPDYININDDFIAFINNENEYNNYSITFNEPKDITIEDIINGNIDMSIYNKIIKTDILKTINFEKISEKYDEIYKIVKNSNNFQSQLFCKKYKIKEYIGVDEEKYMKFLLYLNQYKSASKYKSLILQNTIKNGNIAYIYLLKNKEANTSKLNTIKSFYICLNEIPELDAYNNKLFIKIKSGKMNDKNILTKLLILKNKLITRFKDSNIYFNYEYKKKFKKKKYEPKYNLKKMKKF